MGQKNGVQRVRVVASCLKLVSGGLPQTIGGDSTERDGHGPKLLVDVAAKPGINEQVALWVLDQSSGHGKVAPVEERSSTVTEGGNTMVDPSHQGENG
jgi:hypothetical protein